MAFIMQQETSKVQSAGRTERTNNKILDLSPAMQADVERLGSKSVEEGLEGLWRLVWTTADDVKPLIAAARLPFAPVQVLIHLCHCYLSIRCKLMLLL